MINRCMDICGSSGSIGRCSKICLVKVFIAGNPENFLKTFAVLDDQSIRSLGCSELFDYFNVPNNLVPDELKTCSGSMAASGRRIRNLVIKSFDGIVHLPFLELTECNAIPLRFQHRRSQSSTHIYILSLKCFPKRTQK